MLKEKRSLKSNWLFLVALLPGLAIGNDDLRKLEKDRQRIESSIAVTRERIAGSSEIGFLPDLYFMLAELILEKSKVMRLEKRTRFPTTPEQELDFAAEARVEAEALETYQLIDSRYPKYKDLDKVLFTIAQLAYATQNSKLALQTYKRLASQFPGTEYARKAQLEIGNIFFDKKDFAFAYKQYELLINKDASAESLLAQNRAAKCLSFEGKFLPSLKMYDGLIQRIKNAEPTTTKNIPDLHEETLVAMIWPYSELTPKDLQANPEWKDYLGFFESRSADKTDYRTFLKKFGERMEIKVRERDAAKAYLELFRLSDDLMEKKE